MQKAPGKANNPDHGPAAFLQTTVGQTSSIQRHVDKAGPYQIKIDRSMVKCWLLIFRCSTVGAIHCKMIDSMDTSSFLLAVERFLVVRPIPSTIIADNGTSEAAIRH
jgi:hypothetical protein